MRNQGTRARVTALCVGLALTGFAAAPATETVATIKASPEGLKWQPHRPDRHLVLTVSGPGTRIERRFKAGREAWLAVRDGKRGPLPDGRYRWELRAVPELDAESRKRLGEAREARDQGREISLEGMEEVLKGPFVQSGSFSVLDGRLVNPGKSEPKPERKSEGDLMVAGDLEVAGRKAFKMADPSSDGSIIYVALEGPEAGTYFRGAAKTVGGEAAVELPAHFTKVTEAQGLTVQLTPLRGWSRLYVAEVTPEVLVVRDADGKDGVQFTFLVQGVRKGYLDHDVERSLAEDKN